MRRYLLPIALAAAVALVVPTLMTRAESSASWLSAQDVRARQARESVLVIDVRTPMEYARGHVAGSINVPYSEMGRHLDRIRSQAEGRPVVLYCRSGRRARIAERVLASAGVEPIWHLEGQFAGWAAHGLPVSRR